MLTFMVLANVLTGKHGTPVRSWPGRVAPRPTVLVNPAMSTQTRAQVEATGWTRQTDPRNGDQYLECEGCGIEAVADRAPHANHREGCEVSA